MVPDFRCIIGSCYDPGMGVKIQRSHAWWCGAPESVAVYHARVGTRLGLVLSDSEYKPGLLD